MAFADRVPDELAEGTPASLRRELAALLGPERVAGRVLDLVRYASDASPYRLIPRAVVVARDAEDVAKALEFGRRNGLAVTLRSAGTSLNGQAQGDGLLVDVRRHWRGVEVREGGELVRVRPGTPLGFVNRVLARHGRKLGPDPASSDFATAGGVIANNSGGMRCGVVHDSYRTVRSLRFLLPSGTLLDTAEPGAEARFAAAEPELASGLERIRDEIRADPALAERIRSKFEIKNTTGYRLCAFLDADTPLEIFRRLLIGSEGTLGFVCEAVFETVPLGRHTSTALLLFADIDQAAEAVPSLVAAGASATELMVAATLMVAAYNFPGTPEEWKQLPLEAAAILVEFRSDAEAELGALEARGREALAGRELLRPAEFTRDRELTELFWRVREGMHGLVGSLRPPGTALIIEDVCVPPERIAESARDIQELLGKHGFLQGVAGHASAGNLHFMLTPDFTKPEDRDRYRAFMEELVELVVAKYDGSLKAEHGTGRNMAPFVEREWGPKATEMMWRIKGLADPDAVLGPGVVLNRDPEVHMRDLKSVPPIEEVATTCVECGFCEPVCPSRDLTTTPRQRIVIRREMARQPAGSPALAALEREWRYDAVETCAADGTCRIACPVAIDTGRLVKGLREGSHGPRAERAAERVARRYAAAERVARAALRAGAAPGGGAAMRALSRAGRRALGDELVPLWTDPMPPPAPRLPRTEREGAAAVYLPACINRIFGRARGASGDGEPRSLAEAMVALSARAGRPLWIPPDVAGHCCAVPWASKGYRRGAELMANRTVEALWRWSGEGALPVVLDASSCALGLAEEAAPYLSDANRERHAKLAVRDSVAWARDELLPRLRARHRLGAVAVHPTCATRHLREERALAEVAAAIAEEVVVPIASACCGFAGDRGFLHPELTEAATAPIAAELAGRRFDAYLSSNRTCEIGMERATGAPYESFAFALEELTRPAA